ncbi:MAG TPA: nucleotide-binding protein [Porticoccaceae bacterium]|nr:nucleotide-binding protein [Porticoccaceae bacterium]
MKKALLTQALSLLRIVENNYRSGKNTHYQIGESLNSLRIEALKYVSPEHMENMERLVPLLKIRKHAPYTIESEAALLICKQLVSILEDENPTKDIQQPKMNEPATVQRIVPDGGQVFLVHGHDTANTLKLRILLSERFGLSPVILSEQPSKGRTVVEKFEDEAGKAAYAFALLTPDDFIASGDTGYSQARPNVLFELGWFYGRLGRSRVSMLLREGTNVPSDLGGIARIQFASSIEEKIIELESELRAAGLLR